MASRLNGSSQRSEERPEPPRDTFDADDLDAVQACCRRLGRELVWMVEVRRREPVRSSLRVPVLTVTKVLFDDGPEAVATRREHTLLMVAKRAES